MPKTRTPKKTTTTDGKEKKTRKLTNPEDISAALMSYSAARCDVDAAKIAVHELDDPVAAEVVAALRLVRIGFKAIRSAREDITKNLKKNAWVKVMLAHLKLWEEKLDESWEEAQGILDE